LYPSIKEEVSKSEITPGYITGNTIDNLIIELYTYRTSLEIPKTVLQRSLPQIFKSKKSSQSLVSLQEVTASFFPLTNASTLGFSSTINHDYFKSALEATKQCCVCYGESNIQISMCGHFCCTECLQMNQGHTSTPCPACRTQLTLLDWFSCTGDSDPPMHPPPRVFWLRRLIYQRSKRTVIVPCKTIHVLENVKDWLSEFAIPFTHTTTITNDKIQLITFRDLEAHAINSTPIYKNLQIIFPVIQGELYYSYKQIRKVLESYAGKKSKLFVWGEGKDFTYL
jgi:hypothetical protein